MTDWRPVRRQGGYLPIEDHALLGDGSGSALVGVDAGITWLAAPRFDSRPVFAGLLDVRRGGRFGLDVEGVAQVRQSYRGDTTVLATELRTADGAHLEVVDCMTLHRGADLHEQTPAARGELLRQLHVRSGTVRVRVHVDPRGGAQVQRGSAGWQLRCPDLPVDLRLATDLELDGLDSTVELAEGDRRFLLLSWGASGGLRTVEPDALRASTEQAWTRWAASIDHDGPAHELVRRSAITLKALDHVANGAIVAAATSSLPEWIGGERNWDYRYTWVRDAAFSVYALRRTGLASEADAFLGWVLDAVEQRGEPLIMYDLDGHAAPEEVVDAGLEGYRASAPVRWGNGAAFQRQHDVYGEILDCAYQWAAHGGVVDARLWRRLSELTDAAATAWRVPDKGIWEVRSEGRRFTYSVAMCSVALDRALRMSERFGLPEGAGWRAARDAVVRVLDEQAYDAARGTFTEQLGGGHLDASLLTLPLRRVVAFDDPRMVGTVDAVVRELGAGGGLLHRYDHTSSPDGLDSPEGAFLLCSFWLVDNLAGQGRLEEAAELFESLCGRANHVGLLPEEVDPRDGSFLGNFPQAFSHVGVVSSAVNLSRRRARTPP